MDMKKIEELQKRYDFELDKIVSEIVDSKAKIVLLQFPDGLKPNATLIVDWLEKQKQLKHKVNFLIWFGSCFGACDIPVPAELERLNPKIDLVVQFGHSELLPSY